MMNFRYLDRDSAIHRLNALCKLAWVISLLTTALLLNHPVYLGVLFLGTLPVVIAAGILREWALMLKYTLYLCLAIMAINILINHQGEHILWQSGFRIPGIGVPSITREAILFSLGMSLRLVTIISAFTVLTLTIHPDDVVQALLKVRIPYKSVLACSLSLRFLPLLIEDAKRISDIQRSRGLELDRGHLFQKISRRVTVIIPLLSNSLDRTVQVAEAMESRAFGSGTKRVFYKKLDLNRLDAVTLAIGAAPLAGVICLCCLGKGDFQYFPTTGDLLLNYYDWLWLLFFVHF
jgi:energy-coupling factor transport system permease protein